MKISNILDNTFRYGHRAFEKINVKQMLAGYDFSSVLEKLPFDVEVEILLALMNNKEYALVKDLLQFIDLNVLESVFHIPILENNQDLMTAFLARGFMASHSKARNAIGEVSDIPSKINIPWIEND